MVETTDPTQTDPRDKPLTPKEKRFADAYLGEAKGNGTQAVRIAEYEGKSDEVLRVIASRLLTKVNVRAYIDNVLTAESASAAEVLRELRDVAFSDWGAHLVEIRDPKTGELLFAKVDLGDKVKALELLGKHHKLFTDKVEVEPGERALDLLRAKLNGDGEGA